MAQALSNLPIGAKVKFGSYNGKVLTWLLASSNGTMITEYIFPKRAFDVAESNREYGYAHYGQSNIRQWLNSDQQSWYSAAHTQDSPPPYRNEYGFLYYFSANEKNALQTVTITTRNVTGSGNGTYITSDKVFLPSAQDVSTNQYDFTESSLLPLFGNSSHLKGTTNGTTEGYWYLRTPSPTHAVYVLMVNTRGEVVSEFPYQTNYGVRPCVKLSPQIKVSDTTDSAGYYTVIFNSAPSAPSILNIPNTIYGGKSNSISWNTVNDPDGDALTYQLECSINGGAYTQLYNGFDTSYAHLLSYGISDIRYRVKATDPLGESSAYTTSALITVINNKPPVISGSNHDLGVKTDGFTGTYTVTDGDNNAVTVVEAIDGVRIRSFVATVGQTNTYGITGNTWLMLSNGSHTLTITATDGIDTDVRTITFSKSVETLTIRNSTPWVASTKPTRIMLVVTRNIPSAATFKVEVCNNGYDASPTWEDATDAVLSGLVHVFRNSAKTASNWGVLVRVTVSRNGATGACYVSAIGGNFE